MAILCRAAKNSLRDTVWFPGYYSSWQYNFLDNRYGVVSSEIYKSVLDWLYGANLRRLTNSPQPVLRIQIFWKAGSGFGILPSRLFGSDPKALQSKICLECVYLCINKVFEAFLRQLGLINAKLCSLLSVKTKWTVMIITFKNSIVYW